jgi:hypothetical protein
VRADERRTRAAAHQADTGPQVRGDLEVVCIGEGRAPTVQRAHALLSDRFARGQCSRRSPDRRRVKAVEQPLRLLPGLLARVARERVDAESEAQVAALLGGQPTDPGDLLRDLRRRLTPGEVDVGVLGRDRSGGADEPPK